MIRQPDFVTHEFAQEIIEITKKKKPHDLLEKTGKESVTEFIYCGFKAIIIAVKDNKLLGKEFLGR